jgi:hypothetical protein
MRVLCPAILFLLACGTKGPTYHSDIAPLVGARCAGCHVKGGIAPFSLGSYDEVKAMGPAMVADVTAGLMPPWKAGASDVEYMRNPKLTSEQLATLKDWVDDGLPEGNPSATPVTVAPIGGGIDRVDLGIDMPVAFTPTQVPDEYRCFAIRWPATETKYITGFNAIPGAPQEVHHIALYLIPPEHADEPFQWDDAEPGPGYECFGGPNGTHPLGFAAGVLNAWIPGYQGVAFPRGLGEKIEPGSVIVVQMHYNLASTTAVPDLSRIEFKLDDTVQTLAAYQPFLNLAWVGGQLDIPPGGMNVLYEYQVDPRQMFTALGSPLDLTNGFNIEAVMFHMHSLGSIGELFLDKADGSHVNVLTIPHWDFHWQMEYYLTQPVRFEPGDQLRVRCTFNNPQMKEVKWGESTEDEMCVANVFSSQVAP